MTLRKVNVTKKSSRARCHNVLWVEGVAKPASEQARAIGANLLRHRNERGFSQRELANRAGVHHNTVMNIEHGLGGSRESYERLAEALGITLDDLVAMPVSSSPSGPLIDRFVQSWWCAKLAQEHGMALTTAEESWLRTSQIAEWLGTEEPPDKAIYLLVLARRERSAKERA